MVAFFLESFILHPFIFRNTVFLKSEFTDYLFLATLGPCRGAQAPPHGGLSCCGAQASLSEARGIFPDPGSDPCPLYCTTSEVLAVVYLKLSHFHILIHSHYNVCGFVYTLLFMHGSKNTSRFLHYVVKKKKQNQNRI